MAALPNVTHEAFAQAYAVFRQGSRAIEAARIESEDPRRAALNLLGRQDVADRIQELSRKRLKNADITAERVMLELGRIAFADPRKMFDTNGDLIPIHMLDDDDAASIAGYEIEDRVIGNGPDAIPIRTRKIKRVDKNPALQTLAKHFRIVGDEGDGLNAIAAALADRLRTARRRVIDSSETVEAIEDAKPADAIPAPVEPPLEDEQLW